MAETNECIDLKPTYVPFCSKKVEPSTKCIYTNGENRTTVWIKKEYAATQIAVADPFTSVCVSVKTERGDLLVYGTIVGVFGHPSQNVDGQIADWSRVSDSEKKDICVAGDLNIQYKVHDPFRNGSKEKIASCFKRLGMVNLTSGIAGNVDHIAISERFLAKTPHAETQIWNIEKTRHVPRLSDHLGIAVTLK